MNRNLRLGLLCGAVLACALLWVLGGARRRSEEPASRTEPEASSTRDDPAPQLMPSREPRTAPRSETIAYRGRVEFVGQAGVAPTSGTFLVALGSEGAPTPPFRLSIERGAWELDAPAEARLRLYEGELDGLPAWPVRPELRLEAEQDNLLRVSRQALVWVVDAESGADLAEVTTLSTAGKPLHVGTLPHSGRCGDESGSTLAAPFSSSALRSPGIHLVTAPGFTWAVLALLDKAPVSELLRLEPAGALRIRIGASPGLAARTCVLRALEADGEDESETALYVVPLPEPEGESRIDKLREGNYRLRLVLDPDEPTEALAWEGRATVRRGRETLVEVGRIELAPPVAPTSVRFLLSGDERALAELTHLKVYAGISKTRVPGISETVTRDRILHSAPGNLEFEPVALWPGPCRVELLPFGRVEFGEVPAETDSAWQIRIPELREYSVRVLDEDSRLPIPFSACRIGSCDPSESEGLLRLLPSGRSLTPSEPLLFRAVPGALRIAVFLSEGGIQYGSFDGRERRDFEFLVRKTRELRLGLRSRGRPLPVSIEWWTRLRLRSEAEEEVRFLISFDPIALPDWHSSVLLLFPGTAGRLRLQLPPMPGRTTVDGFRGRSLTLDGTGTPPMLEIDVDSGTWIE